MRVVSAEGQTTILRAIRQRLSVAYVDRIDLIVKERTRDEMG